MLSNGRYQYISGRSAYVKKACDEEGYAYFVGENGKNYALLFTREEKRLRGDKVAGWYLVRDVDDSSGEEITSLYSLSYFQQILSFGYIGLGIPFDEDREGLRDILREWPVGIK